MPETQTLNAATGRPLHLAIVTETYPPEINGVAMTLARLAAALRDNGHRVSVVVVLGQFVDARLRDDRGHAAGLSFVVGHGCWRRSHSSSAIGQAS